MFSKKNLQHIATIFLIFIILFSTLTNKSLAQNSSAYNDIRDTVDKSDDEKFGCKEDADSDEPNIKEECYTSEYDQKEVMCKKSKIKFDPFDPGVDMKWNYSNAACLGYIAGAGVALQIAFYGCEVACPYIQANNAAQELEEAAQAAQAAQDYSKSLKLLTSSKFSLAAESAAKSAITMANTAVVSAGSAALTAQQIGIPIDPSVAAEIAYWGYRCALGGDSVCCGAFAACTGSVLLAIGILASIWDIANDSFENVTICGNGWIVWHRFNEQNEQKRWKTMPGNYAICLKKIFGGNTPYCAQGDSVAEGVCSVKEIDDLKIKCNDKKNQSQFQYCKFIDQAPDYPCAVSSSANIKEKKDNIHYREFIFQGIEYIDNGSGACDNPTTKDTKAAGRWKTILGYASEGKQRYYFRGSNQSPNFACERFLNGGRQDKSGVIAFNCCQKNSQNTICLERFDKTSEKNKHKFCRRGEYCATNWDKPNLPIKYNIFESEKNKNFICAKTYSSCPYDHNVQGGTDTEQYYHYNPQIRTNFCQYMNHCIKLPPVSDYPQFNPDTFFFAESCKDLRGDSQFFDQNASDIKSSMYSRNFSAPMVQCFKETLENQFMQKAGITICQDPEETPQKTKANPDGECKTGNYKQRKGQVVNQTFFTRVQNRFLIPIKIALVLSVAMFGFNILLATPETFINKKTVMTYLVKFGLVYFFVIGNAWQSFFMDSVMNVSSEFANITFSPKATDSTSSGDDGCNFPRYNYLALLEQPADPRQRITSLENAKNNASYPPGKSYLSIWDTLDCKIARAIGYGPEVSTPNLAIMIFAGFITGGLGIMFFFAAFAYALMLFSIAMRAIHITIMSIMGVMLLIYVSPLTITCALFERTKGIFENWWKQMLGFILQPMILFAYLGLMLTVFDDLFIGDAKFESSIDGNLPKINCKKNNEEITNPMENSIYCILQLSTYKNYTGLELFGITYPVLKSMNKEKINTLTRAAIIMFVFLKFLDTITLVAKKLVGGVELKADSTSNIQNLLKKVAKGVQKRALNTTKKLATKTIPNMAKKAIRSNSKSMPEGDKKPTSGGDFAGGTPKNDSEQ